METFIALLTLTGSVVGPLFIADRLLRSAGYKFNFSRKKKPSEDCSQRKKYIEYAVQLFMENFPKPTEHWERCKEIYEGHGLTYSYATFSREAQISYKDAVAEALSYLGVHQIVDDQHIFLLELLQYDVEVTFNRCNLDPDDWVSVLLIEGYLPNTYGSFKTTKSLKFFEGLYEETIEAIRQLA